MAVDKAAITAYLDEIGFDDETKATLIGQLEKDENKAQKFVGQRLRYDDYTRKSQALSTDKAAMERKVAEQVQAYAQQLQEAQSKVDKIMQQYEDAQITATAANARLQRVKEHFGLSDEDVPPVELRGESASTAGSNNKNQNSGPGLDIQAKLDEFKNQFKGELMKELLPELLAFPRISAQQLNLAEKHRALTGKGLSDDEWVGLLKKAEEQRKPLVQVWQDEYKIGDLEKENEFQARLTKEREKWEAEEQRKRSEAALNGANPIRVDSTRPLTSSPVFSKEFKISDPSTSSGGSGKSNQPDSSKSNTGNNGGNGTKPGWQRAAEKWVSRRAEGIPVGAPLK